MPIWLGIIMLVVSIFLLDSVVLRHRLARRHWVFRSSITGKSDISEGATLLYLPGILADGAESAYTLESVFRRNFDRVVRISYGFWRFVPTVVIEQTARTVGRHESGDSIVIFGSSMGSKIAMDVIRLLRTDYGWSAKDITLVMGDMPPGWQYFAQGIQKVTAHALTLVYPGPLLNRLIDPLLRLGLVPPRDENIEEGLDHAEVKAMALSAMAKFHFSAIADQQRYLVSAPIDWPAVAGVKVIYMSCILNNETVAQPAAVDETRKCLNRYASSFDVIEVESPHMAFVERRSKWHATLAWVFLAACSSNAHGEREVRCY